MVSISCSIKFGTLHDIPNRSNKHFLSGRKWNIDMYQFTDYKVDDVMMSEEFENFRFD
jgi:hypothetical protein